MTAPKNRTLGRENVRSHLEKSLASKYLNLDQLQFKFVVHLFFFFLYSCKMETPQSSVCWFSQAFLLISNVKLPFCEVSSFFLSFILVCVVAVL